MKISIFGLGYVGCTTAACLTEAGHQVWGVDINQEKVDMINAGRSPIIEGGIEERIVAGRNTGELKATTDSCEAILATEISFICVGTPSESNGSLDLSVIKIVTEQIGKALNKKGSYHCVVFRSTILPGSVRNVLIPILSDSSGKEVHSDFDVCFHPEFLREGSSIADFYDPCLTIIGQETDRGGDTVARLYDGMDVPIERANYEVAEMVKYSCNAFHATKVIFANEVGVLCKGLGIDSRQVMELFALDKKLNISPAYLKPGFAFGGSCLPKDVRALLYKAKDLDINLPMFGSLLQSNHLHVERAINWVLSKKDKKVGVVGLSFKAGTDDLRESPTITLIEALIGKGCQLKIYDSEVSMAKIFGANKEFIEKEIPHISSLMCANVLEVVKESNIIVICKNEKGLKETLESCKKEKIILDLVGVDLGDLIVSKNIRGICW